jgi:tetratricopeptide (TPR) repeat protein
MAGHDALREINEKILDAVQSPGASAATELHRRAISNIASAPSQDIETSSFLYAEALALLQKALVLNSHDAGIHKDIAVIYRDFNGDFDKALEHLKIARIRLVGAKAKEEYIDALKSIDMETAQTYRLQDKIDASIDILKGVLGDTVPMGDTALRASLQLALCHAENDDARLAARAISDIFSGVERTHKPGGAQEVIEKTISWYAACLAEPSLLSHGACLGVLLKIREGIFNSIKATFVLGDLVDSPDNVDQRRIFVESLNSVGHITVDALDIRCLKKALNLLDDIVNQDPRDIDFVFAQNELHDATIMLHAFNEILRRHLAAERESFAYMVVALTDIKGAFQPILDEIGYTPEHMVHLSHSVGIILAFSDPPMIPMGLWKFSDPGSSDDHKSHKYDLI